MKCLKKYGQKVKFDLIGLENDKSFRRPRFLRCKNTIRYSEKETRCAKK